MEQTTTPQPDDGLTPWQRWKKNLGETRPWDLLSNNPVNFVNDEIADKRLAFCSECPYLLKISYQCKLCGCFMKAKAKLAHAECPIQKWGKEDVA